MIPDPLLMVVTILVVTGFQGWWLKTNYDREKRTMQLKSNIVFQETVRQLQTSKLNLEPAMVPGHKGNFRIMVDDHEENMGLPTE